MHVARVKDSRTRLIDVVTLKANKRMHLNCTKIGQGLKIALNRSGEEVGGASFCFRPVTLSHKRLIKATLTGIFLLFLGLLVNRCRVLRDCWGGGHGCQYAFVIIVKGCFPLLCFFLFNARVLMQSPLVALLHTLLSWELIPLRFRYYWYFFMLIVLCRLEYLV